MDLFLHIGTEKTGTTSVQKFFKANRELLARNGIVYPAAPGNQNHTGLAASAQDVEKRGPLRKSLGIKNEADVLRFRAEMLTELAAELSERPYKTAFMSGEHCSSRLLEDAEVEWLKGELGKFFERMHIVVYIRRQDDYLLSTYSTAVKSGATYPLRIPPDRAIEQRYDHWDMLQRWARVFGARQGDLPQIRARDAQSRRHRRRRSRHRRHRFRPGLRAAGGRQRSARCRNPGIPEAFQQVRAALRGPGSQSAARQHRAAAQQGFERTAGDAGRGRTRPVHGAFQGNQRPRLQTSISAVRSQVPTTPCSSRAPTSANVPARPS